MKINNGWINHEDELFFFFGAELSLKKSNYKDIVFQLNLDLHKITLKHEILMPLSPAYCNRYGINAYEHYERYLFQNQDDLRLFQIGGYEFYEKKFNRIKRVSKMFFKNKSGEVESKYVHYLFNNYYGNPTVVESGSKIENASLKKFSYDDCPLSIALNMPPDFDNEKLTIGFSIESHCSIWLDKTPLFKLQNEDGTMSFFENLDNRELAYKNTPRLNSFLRDIREVVFNYGGTCILHNHKSILECTEKTSLINKFKAKRRKGLLIDGKIIYQEDLEEGRVSF